MASARRAPDHVDQGELFNAERAAATAASTSAGAPAGATPNTSSVVGEMTAVTADDAEGCHRPSM